MGLQWARQHRFSCDRGRDRAASAASEGNARVPRGPSGRLLQPVLAGLGASTEFDWLGVARSAAASPLMAGPTVHIWSTNTWWRWRREATSPPRTFAAFRCEPFKARIGRQNQIGLHEPKAPRERIDRTAVGQTTRDSAAGAALRVRSRSERAQMQGRAGLVG